MVDEFSKISVDILSDANAVPEFIACEISRLQARAVIGVFVNDSEVGRFSTDSAGGASVRIGVPAVHREALSYFGSINQKIRNVTSRAEIGDSGIIVGSKVSTEDDFGVTANHSINLRYL